LIHRITGRAQTPDPLLDRITRYQTANQDRYWYANNNPYKYIDPDGGEVVFAFQNGASLRDGLSTMRYLGQSKTFRAELRQLQNSRESYKISFDRNSNAIMRYDDRSRTITIDPTAGLRIDSSGEIQSPALGGAHEVSHAAEHDRVGTEQFKAALDAPLKEVGDRGYSFGTPPEESRATKVEGKIAHELGEPSRKNYADERGTVRTCGPTSRSEC